MCYFDSAARHHHADEEDDLFPALIESKAGSDAICLREVIDGLKADQRALKACWRPTCAWARCPTASGHG
ncbi:MAG: hypothetical protein DVS81_12415 [Candidatus Accumulibacter meliphilus]|jgi:hypothetical protein|uniref:Hemerythrin-like domain-containing protein n=1 Tax=Candidatus Accumulibacter meliphilus TaxID=2211374 RepID=A0A369XLH3_9PROT|nr:MAG: hypothetical protein DVS81_12415 [Candidatus Accumulibacter meliphilus]